MVRHEPVNWWGGSKEGGAYNVDRREGLKGG